MSEGIEAVEASEDEQFVEKLRVALKRNVSWRLRSTLFSELNAFLARHGLDELCN